MTFRSIVCRIFYYLHISFTLQNFWSTDK